MDNMLELARLAPEENRVASCLQIPIVRGSVKGSVAIQIACRAATSGKCVELCCIAPSAFVG
jgi:hypothetical protein